MNDSAEQFKNAIRAAGLEPPEKIELGKWHRFPGLGKPKGNKDASCKLFVDGLGGYYHDFSSDVKGSWQAKRDKLLSWAEQTIFMLNLNEARKREAKELQKRHDKAAELASSIWEGAEPAPDSHPYLVRKGIKAHGARLENRALIIPIGLGDHRVISLQFIHPNCNRKKIFLPGSRTKGGFCCLGTARGAETVCITEGFATGATIREATGYPVIVAFSAYNLEHVAITIKHKLPDAQIIICADDDIDSEGNPGVTEANRASRTIGAKVAIPEFADPRPKGVTDFNDMSVLIGLKAVAEVINAAR